MKINLNLPNDDNIYEVQVESMPQAGDFFEFNNRRYKVVNMAYRVYRGSDGLYSTGCNVEVIDWPV